MKTGIIVNIDAAVDAIIEQFPSEDFNRGYYVQMWKSALGEPREEPSAAWDKRALPYVPLRPEDFGLRLTPDSTILDVGCLSGYGLYDFYVQRASTGHAIPRLVGLDVNPKSVEIGRRLARAWAEEGRVHFCLSSCEAIACEAGAFDMLIARSVLQYVNIEKTLSEFARVLRPGGLSLIEVHGPGYYWSQSLRNLLRPMAAGHYLRPLLSRLARGLTERQPRHRWFRETALDTDELIALCRRHDLSPVWSWPDRYHPMVLFRRDDTPAGRDVDGGPARVNPGRAARRRR
jgi:SAM-dependent methyltransferase